MGYVHLLLLALVQGITEFLPVSSSGHLILLPNVLGIADQGLALDVAVHVGTLGAVTLYFWSDVVLAVKGIPPLLRRDFQRPEARLAGLLALATVPVVIVGAALKITGLADAMRSPALIGWTTLIFGLVLYAADRRGGAGKDVATWRTRDAVTLGLWQALALVPGVSRSGITITGARLLGFGRAEAARVAMLMSIPTIAASGVLLGGDVVAALDWPLLRDAAIAAGMAFVAALAALHAMMRLLQTISFTPYVLYRIALGLLILGFTYA